MGWWLRIVPALWRLRQVAIEFGGIMFYIIRPRSFWATKLDPFSKQ